MRCQLVREYDFEAAHSLPKVPEGHKCARVHGHSYRVTIVIEGDIDPEMGWLMDFAAIDEGVDAVIGQLDHRYLNDIDGLSNPTSELLAQWMWQRIKPGLDVMTELAVSETPTSKCVYRGQ
jgi:6-pyruvoyltetrahydropterin/6-carboxytetrahydropterin synthase